MTDLPVAPPADEKDWTWVITAGCPECGYDGPSIDRTELPERTRAAMRGFADLLGSGDPRERPAPDVWSPLEYACHVRDVCATFGGRVESMLTEDDPLFPNWDQDAAAIEGRYWEQDPAAIADECVAGGERMAAIFASVRDDQWQRPGRRSNGSVFTVETIGVYFLHDLQHHLHDVAHGS